MARPDGSRRAVADRGDGFIALIEAARARGYQAVNTVLVEHYWELGAYISRKIASAQWGEGAFEGLAADLTRRYPRRMFRSIGPRWAHFRSPSRSAM